MTEEPSGCALLAERHRGLSEGVRGLLEAAFGAVVMVADAGSLLEAAGRLVPEAAIVDLSLAGDGNLAWLRELRVRCPDLMVIALSSHDEHSVRHAALEAGADAVVLKRAIATDLLTAVDAVRARHAAGAPIDTPSPANPRDPPARLDLEPEDGAAQTPRARGGYFPAD